MIFIIISRTDEEKVLKILNEYKLGFKVVMYGQGTASSSLLEYFGLTDEVKAIVTAIAPPIICKNLFVRLREKLNVEEHGRGIAFCVPLSSGTKYMVDFYSKHKMEDIDMEEIHQHLIVTVVNQGYAEKVMNAAKSGGATGGTTINGRGLASEKAIKFLNISIEPEKDVVLILVPTDKKNDVMNIIVENCGLKTMGAGICFSLPVEHVVGLNNQIDN